MGLALMMASSILINYHLIIHLAPFQIFNQLQSMRSQYSHTQTYQSSNQSANTYAEIHRDSRVSNQSTNSRKRIFQQPQSTFDQTQSNYQSQFTPHQPNPPLVSNPPNAPTSKQLPPKPSNIIPTDNSKTNNPLSQYAFQEPRNFDRKTMIAPSTHNTVMNQNRTKSKLEALARLKYLNPLARLDYEDKELEVYTKISKQTQEQASKKIRARNQLAHFEEDPIDEQKEIDDLIEFKLGRTGKHGFITHFEKEEESVILDEREYCTNCEVFVPQLHFQSHVQECREKPLPNQSDRGYELQDKINRVYKLLLQQEESEQNQTLKGYLVDLSSINDKRGIQSLSQNLQKLRCQGQLRTLCNRIHQFLRIKSSLL